MTPLSQGGKLPLVVPPRWTSGVESAASVRFWAGAFRVFTACVIVVACVHYAMTVPADAADVPQPAIGHALSSLLAAGLHHLSPSSRWLLAAGLACAIVLGLAPRVSAAALAAVLASRPPVGAMDAAFDVPMISLIAIWLVILPASGRSGIAGWAKSAFKSRPASIDRHPRWTIELCMCSFGVVYMNVFCWRRAFAHWDAQPVAALAAAAIVSLSLLASQPRWRYAATMLQIGFHLGLAAIWGHPVGNILFASMALLQFGRAAAAGEPALVDASAICALTTFGVIVLFIAAQVLGFAMLVQTAGGVLSNLGPLVSLYALD